MYDYKDIVNRLRTKWGDAEAECDAANAIEYLAAEEDRLWTKINKMTVVIKLMDARIEKLEDAIKPFAEYYVNDCNDFDPDDCLICEADEEENNLTVGLFREAYKVLEGE